MLTVRVLTAEEASGQLDALASVLVGCVEGGASVNFMSPYTHEQAKKFFESVLRDAEAGNRILLGAFQHSQLIGTVQVLLAMPPNQPHRGEIAKLLVAPEARGAGVGARLMRKAEQCAQLAGKTLLVLDTANATAEALYERLGWTRLGTIPGYALLPDGAPCGTTIFWKQI
jgi:ribosomal protein S18 acetylase RimI-like enzyme